MNLHFSKWSKSHSSNLSSPVRFFSSVDLVALQHSTLQVFNVCFPNSQYHFQRNKECFSCGLIPLYLFASCSVFSFCPQSICSLIRENNFWEQLYSFLTAEIVLATVSRYLSFQVLILFSSGVVFSSRTDTHTYMHIYYMRVFRL